MDTSFNSYVVLIISPSTSTPLFQTQPHANIWANLELYLGLFKHLESRLFTNDFLTDKDGSNWSPILSHYDHEVSHPLAPKFLSQRSYELKVLS